MRFTIRRNEEKLHSCYYGGRMLNTILHMNNGEAMDALEFFAHDDWKREFPDTECILEEIIIEVNDISDYYGGKDYFTISGSVTYKTSINVEFTMSDWTGWWYRDTKKFSEVTNNMLSRTEPDIEEVDLFRLLWQAVDKEKIKEVKYV